LNFWNYSEFFKFFWIFENFFTFFWHGGFSGGGNPGRG
jgi:hypothetical protein